MILSLLPSKPQETSGKVEPLDQKNETLILIILTSIIFLISFVCANTNQPVEKEQRVLPIATPTPVQTSVSSAFPLKLVDLKEEWQVDAKEEWPNDIEVEDISDCQPELFDPAASKYTKIKQNGAPSEMYEVEGTKEHFMIDGWYKEGEDKIILPDPYSLTQYGFGCASTFSSVLELKNNNVRQALYTHVPDFKFSFSEDKKFLYMINEVKNSMGTWDTKIRIIDIVNDKAVDLPSMECIGKDEWAGEKLITFSDLDYIHWKIEEKMPNAGFDEHMKFEEEYKTKFCIWDKKGQLEKQLEGDFSWMAPGNSSELDAQVGLLPSDQNIFYAYASSVRQGGNLMTAFYTCKVWMMVVNKKQRDWILLKG